MKATVLVQTMLRYMWLTAGCTLLFIGWLLGGCTHATGHFFSPAKHLRPDQTMVYLYFPRQPGRHPHSHTTILANGTTVTRLDQGGYYPLRAAPGRMTFSLPGDPENQNLTVTGEGGHTHFVKVLIHQGTLTNQLFLVNEELAHGEMGPLRLMDTCDNPQGCTQNLP
jgi:hypothetical protein